MTHAFATEAHSAGFSFAKVKEAAIGLDERRAGAITSPAADLTGVLRLCKNERRFPVLYVKIYICDIFIDTGSANTSESKTFIQTCEQSLKNVFISHCPFNKILHPVS